MAEAHTMMKYCADCGAPLVLQLEESSQKERACCTECGHIHYRQLKVGAGALIERDKRLLLLQRAKAPFAGCWNLPAGYVEADESPIQAVIREVYEEVGLQAEVTDLIDVYFFNDDPRGNGILIIYRCLVVDGALSESEEAIAPTFFTSKDIPRDLAGGGHDQAIAAWKKSRVQDL